MAIWGNRRDKWCADFRDEVGVRHRLEVPHQHDPRNWKGTRTVLR
jgi:hypothetical protein